MSHQVLVTAARQGSRCLRIGTGLRASSTRVGPSLLANLRNNGGTNRLPQTPVPGSTFAARTLMTTAFRRGIMPDDKPVSPKEDINKKIITPADITDEEFHQAADDYLDMLQAHLEDLQDKREEVDVDYSAGVLSVNFGPDVGTYVINKQPPNKQIWLSSPKSGPKRYDLVVVGDGQHEKAETAASEWMYLRDNSTMNELFIKELGIDLRMPPGQYGE